MNLLVHSQTSTVDKQNHRKLYSRRNYLSMLGAQLNPVSKRDLWSNEALCVTIDP